MEQPRIHRLDPLTANKIAAGEVVERPSAVVKELVENAMDADAGQITVEVRQGGKTYIRISDNGSGIAREDIPLALERHATSKIRSVQDLNTVHSLGFRGEALASIASVSMLELITRTDGAEVGYRVEVQGGRTVSEAETGAPRGTTVIVKDLFFNTPARMKFMKSNGAELAAITEWISRLAVSRPEISFRFVADHQDIFMTSGNGKLLESIAAVYERGLAKSMIPLAVEKDGLRLTGYLGDLSLNRGNRQMQHFIVNGRTVRSNLLSEALEMGYQGLLPINRFPVCFVHVDLDQHRLDVNIHPAKIQIRFQDESDVRQAVFQMVRETLLNRNLMPSVRYRQEEVTRTAVSERVPVFAPPATPGTSAETAPFRSETAVSAEGEARQPNLDTPEHRATRFEASSPSVPTGVADDYQPYPSGLGTSVQEPSDTEALNPAALLMKPEPVPVHLSPELCETYDRETLYDGLRIIGQLFRTYVLAERDDSLYLIDQHAAHEKVLYEQFMSDWKRRAVTTQLLLVPEVLETDPATVFRSEELKPALEQLGFSYDLFGADTLLVREVPLLGATPLPPMMLKQLLQDFARDLEMGKDLTDLRQELIIRESCKRAVKALDRLDTPEIMGLLKQLKGLESPYTCPHGRPIIIAIEKSELERRFRRI